MRATFGIVGLLAALAVGYYVYTAQIHPTRQGNTTPIRQISLTAVRADLLSLAQAERLYMAANGSYAGLDELRSSGNLGATPANGRRGYDYTIEFNGGSHFRISARPSDASQTDLPTMAIDETMQITG